MLKTRFEILKLLYLFCASDNKSVLIKEEQALMFFTSLWEYPHRHEHTQGMLKSSWLEPFP